MMDTRRGLEQDAASRRNQAPAELRLEAKRRAHEVLVEAADGEGTIAADGKVSGHDVRDPGRLRGIKGELEERAQS
jgi:hypothetical protein